MSAGTGTEDVSLLPVEELAERLGVDPRTGLAEEEAAARLAAEGPNELRAKAPRPAWLRFLDQFRDPLVFLLFAAIGISALAWWFEGAEGFPLDVLVIGLILVANAVIGFWQEGRAAEAVAALATMTAASSTVLRGGRALLVPASQLVRGDVLLLAEGDAVGADGILLSATGLKIHEAALTGESEPAEKEAGPLASPQPIGDRRNTVFKGTAVVHGVGRAIVTATGMGTEVGRIATLLDEQEEEVSPLDREIATLTKGLGLTVLVIALIVMSALLLVQRPSSLAGAVDILLVGVSLAVAAVPEGLPAILSLVLALGVQRLAARNAVMKSLHSVETLGSASVICTDKTGTLTRNEMTIRVVVTASGRVELSGTGYSPEGGAAGHARAIAEAAEVVAAGAIANNADLVRGPEGAWTITGDPTEGAFLVAARKLDGVVEKVEAAVRTGEVPFDSVRKLMSVLVTHPGSAPRLITKGAPDILLERCVLERVGEGERRLDAAARRRFLDEVEGLNASGYRTIAVACSARPADSERIGEEDEKGLVLLGVVGIIDPPREEVEDAVEAARRAGIRVVMITGDHPLTAARIASDLGILAEGETVMSGKELDAIDDAALREAAPSVSVYARVAPEHKLRIVDALRADGSIVAMTGDGVNDAPALKAADIGVAMGRTGTEVTKEAATMILGDDDFSTIVDAVRLGRGVFDDIRKFMRYLLSSNMGEVMTVFGGILFAGVLGLNDAAAGGLAVPILAVQILWINLVTDSGPALAMGVDPEAEDVMAAPPRRPDARIVDLDMWARILVMGLVMALATLGVLDAFLPGGLFPGGEASIETARTAAFTTLVFAQLFNALNARSATRSAFEGFFANPWLWGAILLAIALQILVVHAPILQSAFATSALSAGQWGVCALAASSVLWVEEAVKLLRRLAQRSPGPER